jgi:hypothetical protein
MDVIAKNPVGSMLFGGKVAVPLRDNPADTLRAQVKREPLARLLEPPVCE